MTRHDCTVVVTDGSCGVFCEGFAAGRCVRREFDRALKRSLPGLPGIGRSAARGCVNTTVFGVRVDDAADVRPVLVDGRVQTFRMSALGRPSYANVRILTLTISAGVRRAWCP